MRRRSAGCIAGAGIVIAAVGLLALPTAAAAGTSGRLQPLRCRPMATDPALEAPLYAQDQGASGRPDGWWCQLPHATMVPSGFEQLSRRVAPLADLYADYETQYGPVGSAGGQSGPMILVTDDVNSSVAPPPHLSYPPLPRGHEVSLAGGVTATLVRSGQTTTVTWKFPLHGVPKYLRAVAEVTVRASEVPESTVLGVAEHVRPG